MVIMVVILLLMLAPRKLELANESRALTQDLID